MWRAARNGTDVDVSGGVGETLKLNITDTSTPPVSGVWTGFSWSGWVRQTASGLNVSTFTITDNSTSNALSLVATITNTVSWTAGDTMMYRISGSKSGETYYLLEGKVIPK